MLALIAERGSVKGDQIGVDRGDHARALADQAGEFWAIACDDTPWGGTDPPTAVYPYAPSRGREHTASLLRDFCGIQQTDARAHPQDGLRLEPWDGRTEINSNAVERSMRPVALNRKHTLFVRLASGGCATHGRQPAGAFRGKK